MNQCWFPPLIEYDNDSELKKKAFDIFKQDFIASKCYFNDLPIQIQQKTPPKYSKNDTFSHITTKDIRNKTKRVFDPQRSQRFKWIRAIIDNYYKCNKYFCIDCNGIKIWEEKDRNKTKVYFLLKERKYCIVLEKRKTYYLLRTAFYIDHDNYYESLKRRYDKACSLKKNIT